MTATPARHSPSLPRRVDLPRSQWPHPGCRPRRARRKQYRYHPRWREVRDENKYDRMIAFANALPKIRARTKRDLKKPGLTREKVLATVIQLMEKTLIRVGNDEYVRTNDSYGLTTLRDKHAQVKNNKVHFSSRASTASPRDPAGRPAPR